MKTQFLIITTMLLTGFCAMAGVEKAIYCQLKNNSHYKIIIDAGPPEGYNFIAQQAPAKIYMGESKLVLQYHKMLISKPISTRTIVGTSYEVDLGFGDFISLSDINYAPVGFLDEIGFTGTYLHNGQVTELFCN